MRKMRCAACLKVWYLEDEDIEAVKQCPYCGKGRRRQAETGGMDASGRAASDYRRMDSEEGEDSPEEQYARGNRYYAGNGVEQDFEKAVEWYEKAARQGHIEAQHTLGRCYAEGWGVKRSCRSAAERYRKAAEWYRKAAEQGYALAQCSLGILYRNGLGVEKDVVKAREWLRKAAEQGNYFAKGCLERWNLEQGNLEQGNEQLKDSGTPALEDNDYDKEPDIFGEDDWDDEEEW